LLLRYAGCVSETGAPQSLFFDGNAELPAYFDRLSDLAYH
jgi:hypothetical protein